MEDRNRNRIADVNIQNESEISDKRNIEISAKLGKNFVGISISSTVKKLLSW
jgi:hypothetical protein